MVKKKKKNPPAMACEDLGWGGKWMRENSAEGAGIAENLPTRRQMCKGLQGTCPEAGVFCGVEQ